jgi:hypothetical protein
MAPPSGESLVLLLTLASRALGTNQRGLAELLGLSRRTISRWVRAGNALATPAHIDTLARAVHAHDPALAARIVAVRGATLVDAGIVPPEPAPAPLPPPPAPPAPYLVDVVVCAAAEALDVSPRVVRSALLAAFQRARAVGLDVAALESSLAKPARPEPPLKRQRPAAS